MRKPGFKERIEVIKRPPLFMALVVYALAVCFSAGTLICVCFDKIRNSPIAITTYVITSILVVYGIILFINIQKDDLSEIKFTDSAKRMARKASVDFGYKTKVFAAITSFSSLIHAIFDISMAYVYDSFWLASLAAIYFSIWIARLFILIRAYWGIKIFKIDEEQQEYENVLFVGTGFVVSAIAILSIVPFSVMIANGVQIQLSNNVAFIGSVIFVIWKAFLAVRNMFKAQRTDSYVAKTLRYINLLDTSFVIFQLIIVAIYSFSKPTNSAAFISITSVMIFITFVYGVIMVYQGVHDGKKISARAINEANKLNLK